MTSLFEINLSASILVIILIIIRAVLKNRLPKRFFASVWAVVILRLIIPFSVPVEIPSVSPDYSIPMIDRLNGTAVSAGSFDQKGDFYYFYDFSHAEAAKVQNFNSVLIAVSLIITLFLILGFTAIHFKARKKYADALPYDNAGISMFIESYNLRRKISVKYSDRISAPLTYGVIKPVIVLPKACTNGDFEHLECIIAHEMAHIRCFDVLYKWVIMAVVALYWYNPFIWLMFILSERDIEVSCDIEAIEKCGCGGEIYSGLLIGLEEKRCLDIYARGFCAGAIKKRIKAILKRKKSGIAGAVIAVALSVCSFTVFASAHTGVNQAMSLFTPTYFHTDNVSELLWLEPGRYYLEGGTRDEYIEVFDDETIQIFGYDIIEEEYKDSREYYESLSEEELEYRMEQLQEIQEIYDKRHKYLLPTMISSISCVDENGETEIIIIYEDENTFRINGTGKTYKAEKPWKAGVYQGYDEDKLLDFGFGYYYSESDNSYLYISFDVLEIFDENGKGSGPIQYRQVKTDSRPGDVILALNFKELRSESPRGYFVGDEKNTIYDTETGVKYTLKSKPILG